MMGYLAVGANYNVTLGAHIQSTSSRRFIVIMMWQSPISWAAACHRMVLFLDLGTHYVP